MKTPYTYRAEKFIKILFSYIKEELEKKKRSTVDMRACVDAFNKEKKRKVVFDSGASRMVFISSDYVVKVDKQTTCWAGTSEDEFKMYQFAIENGFDHLFAPISSFLYNGYAFYIMPRAHDINQWRNEDFFYDTLTASESEFISDYITDIHGGNFGYLHKDLVLIDYAYNYLSED